MPRKRNTEKKNENDYDSRDRSNTFANIRNNHRKALLNNILLNEYT